MKRNKERMILVGVLLVVSILIIIYMSAVKDDVATGEEICQVGQIGGVINLDIEKPTLIFAGIEGSMYDPISPSWTKICPGEGFYPRKTFFFLREQVEERFTVIVKFPESTTQTRVEGADSFYVSNSYVKASVDSGNFSFNLKFRFNEMNYKITFVDASPW